MNQGPQGPSSLLLGLGNYSAKLHNKVMLFIGGRGERPEEGREVGEGMKRTTWRLDSIS